MNRRPSPLALALLALGCASAPRPAATPAAPAANAGAAPAAGTEEGAEARVARMLAPETTATLAAQPVATPDGSFRGAAQASGAVTVRADETRFVASIPVGGRQNVECIVFPETIDLASALRITAEAVREHTARFELHAIDAGFVGDSPYIDLQFLYLVSSPQGNLLGHVKLRGANVGGRGLMCTHDEPGFVRTFDRATRPLLEAPAASPPITRYVLLVDDRPSGVATNRRVEGATTEEVDVSALLLPRSATDLVALDSVGVEHYNRAGELVDKLDVVNENGEVSRYQLRRQGTARRYRVEGRHLGRDIAGDLTPASPLLAGGFGTQRAWQTFRRANAPAQVEFVTWSHTDPLAATTHTLRLDRRVDDDHLWLTMRTGQSEGRLLQGPAFAPDEYVMDAGGHTIAQRRVAP
ncbi:MAG: hypothetical protein U0324_06115 [Polyangiales bacterium]